MSRTFAHVSGCHVCRNLPGGCNKGLPIALSEFGDVWWYALEQARKGVDVGEKP